MTDLDALSALLAAGRPLPWREDGVAIYSGSIFISSPEPGSAALIVAAVNALPDLIEAARRASEGENTDWHYCDCDSPHHAYHEAARREAGLRRLVENLVAAYEADYPKGGLASALSNVALDARIFLLHHDNAGTAER